MDRHSYFVRFLQIALPVIGIGALLFVFLSDWSSDEVVSEQFSTSDREFTNVPAEVINPNINSRTKEGDEINLQAQSVARQDEQSAVLEAREVSGALDVGGSQWEIQSEEGEADTDSQIAKFRGQVMALIDGRYNLVGTQVVADVRKRVFSSPFPIDVKSERFDISADSAMMKGEAGERIIELDGRVKGQIRLGSLEGALTESVIEENFDGAVNEN